MKKLLILLTVVIGLNACSFDNRPETVMVFDPDYNHLAANARVISKSPLYVTYEYKDIRVDELAAVAAQYCHDRNGKQAALYKITLHRNNARRATFVCRNINAE